MVTGERNKGEGSRSGDDPAFRHLRFRGVEHHPLDHRKVVETKCVQLVGGHDDVLIFVLRIGDANTQADLRQLKILFVHVDRFDIREQDTPKQGRGFRRPAGRLPDRR